MFCRDRASSAPSNHTGHLFSPQAHANRSLALLLPHRYLIKFLAKLAEHQEVNKMTPSNIAIVLGPNLLWTQQSTA